MLSVSHRIGSLGLTYVVRTLHLSIGIGLSELHLQQMCQFFLVLYCFEALPRKRKEENLRGLFISFPETDVAVRELFLDGFQMLIINITYHTLINYRNSISITLVLANHSIYC